MRLLTAVVVAAIIWFAGGEYLGFNTWGWFVNNVPHVGPFADAAFQFFKLPTHESVFGYTFMTRAGFPMPLEPYYIFVNNAGISILAILVLGAVAGTLGAFVSYMIGALLRSKIMQEETFGAPTKGGVLSWILVFGTVMLPIPDFTSLIFGAYRVSLKLFLSANFLGMIVKVILLFSAVAYAGEAGVLNMIPFI